MSESEEIGGLSLDEVSERYPTFAIPESVRRQIEEAEAEERRERSEARAAGAAAAARRLGVSPLASPAAPVGDQPPRARTTDPVTSHLAAASVENLTESQNAVLWMVKSLGPLTDEALVTYYAGRMGRPGFPNQSPSGIRTRRHELTEAGLVEGSGVGSTRSGRKAVLWREVGDDEETEG